jgi:hypothetical protein
MSMSSVRRSQNWPAEIRGALIVRYEPLRMRILNHGQRRKPFS